jgi:NAD(P)H-dependent FMN reductase
MKTLVIYESRFGNTALIARAVADALRERGAAHLLSVEDVAAHDLDGVDLLVVGGPTHAHGISSLLGAWLKRLPADQLRDLPVAAFDTRYRMARLLTGSAARVIARRLGHLGARAIIPPESFFIIEGEGPLAEGEGERAIAWARALAAQVDALRPAAITPQHAVPGEHWQPHP